MTFKVGRENLLPISNIKNKANEAELQKFDVNGDKKLDSAEASRFYAAKKGGKAPTSMTAVYTAAGGRQHSVRSYARDYYQTLYTYAPNGKGNFSVPGLGAGNIRVGRQILENGKSEAFNFLVDCDLIDRSFLEHKLESASIVIGPKDFKPEAGSQLDEKVVVPLNIATADGYNTFDRGGGARWVPEKKFLAASVDVANLRSLAGKNGDLSFYVRLQTTDGKTIYVNKDGQPFNNFQISAAEIKARGRA